ncbi:MAG: hypothetical protein AVDCRST_MAG10-3635, partial [uncultured Acidimicrobiales bacterium]
AATVLCPPRPDGADRAVRRGRAGRGEPAPSSGHPVVVAAQGAFL